MALARRPLTRKRTLQVGLLLLLAVFCSVLATIWASDEYGSRGTANVAGFSLLVSVVAVLVLGTLFGWRGMALVALAGLLQCAGHWLAAGVCDQRYRRPALLAAPVRLAEESAKMAGTQQSSTSPIAAASELLGNTGFLLLVLYFTLPALAGWVVKDWMPDILKEQFDLGQTILEAMPPRLTE